MVEVHIDMVNFVFLTFIEIMVKELNKGFS